MPRFPRTQRGRDGRPTTTQRGLGWQWQQLTEQAYDLYGYWCYATRCLHPTSRVIDPKLPKNTRWSRTVDHTRARAVVGVHLPALEDVRPMHNACNASKGAGTAVSEPTGPSETW